MEHRADSERREPDVAAEAIGAGPPRLERGGLDVAESACSWQRDGYSISTDKERLDTDVIVRLLHEESYWAQHRPRDTISRSIAGSLCFGVYEPDGSQMGFARVVTDRATFGWLCDVIIAPAHRGRGLGKWLIECVMAHPDIEPLLLFLGTRDAQELYRKHAGFEEIRDAGRWMLRMPRKRATPQDAAEA